LPGRSRAMPTGRSGSTRPTRPSARGSARCSRSIPRNRARAELEGRGRRGRAEAPPPRLGLERRMLLKNFTAYRCGGHKASDHRKTGPLYPAGDWRILLRYYKAGQPSALPEETKRWLGEQWAQFKGRNDVRATRSGGTWSTSCGSRMRRCPATAPRRVVQDGRPRAAAPAPRAARRAAGWAGRCRPFAARCRSAMTTRAAAWRTATSPRTRASPTRC
jgi:hypothetical protein